MKHSLKASLEKVVGDWIEANCDHDDAPEGYYHPDMAEQMTAAAVAVYDATFAAQKFLEENS